MKAVLAGVTTVFVTMKLLGVISWPWYAVLIPAYPLILGWLFLVLLFMIALYGPSE